MITVSAMSRSDAIEVSQNLKCKTAIISITGKYSDDVEFESGDNLVDVLHLHFEDFNEVHEDAMTCDDAKQIAEFLDKNIDTINRLIVHCGSGKSRSVGVATAIVSSLSNSESVTAQMLGENGNKYCYDLVTEALNKHFAETVSNRCIMQWSKKCADCKNGELCD